MHKIIFSIMEKIFKLFKHRNKYKETIKNWFGFVFVFGVYFSGILSCITIYFSIKKVLIFNEIIFIKRFLTKNRTARCFGILVGQFCACILHNAYCPNKKAIKKESH